MIDALNGIDRLSSMADNNRANLNIAKARAEAAEFDRVLHEVQRRAEEKKTGENEIDPKKDRELRDACEGFEAMFLTLMYKEMRKTVPENKLFGQSHGEKIWHSMLDEAMMDDAAKSGGVGLADMLYEQLSPQVLGTDGAKIKK